MTGDPPWSIVLVPPMRWWRRLRTRLRVQRQVRTSAGRHLRVVATALLTGDTSRYRLVPSLPRKPGSTDTYGSTSRGEDDDAA